mgnify:FL=1
MEHSECSQVLEGLYLGNYTAAQDLALLQEKGISNVVIATLDHEPLYEDQLSYLQVSALDLEEDLVPHFEQVNFHIDELMQKGAKVLVHW